MPTSSYIVGKRYVYINHGNHYVRPEEKRATNEAHVDTRAMIRSVLVFWLTLTIKTTIVSTQIYATYR